MKKLVRNKIPQIIADSGKQATYHVATRSEQHDWLYKKMVEEAGEFHEDPSMEEAADVYEVWMAMCEHHGLDLRSVIELAAEKRKLRGGFDGRIILEAVK